MFSEMLSYPKFQEVQEVQVVQGGQRWSKLSHILGVTLGVLEALVAQEGQQDLVCHNLGFLVSLALQGGLEGQLPTLLWVPQVLVSQGYLVARVTQPPPCLPSLL